VANSLLETGGQGEFSIQVGSSQKVDISSALPAIAMTPISGLAMELSLASPLQIEAFRLLEPAADPPCRAVVDTIPMVFWPYVNSTADLLAVPETLSFFGRNGLTAETSFAPGRNYFSRELSLFQAGDSWTLLGRTAVLPELVPLCTGSGDPVGCSEITAAQTDEVFDDAVRIVTDTYAFSLQIKRELLRKGWRPTGRQDDYVKLGKPLLRSIRDVLSGTRPEGATIYDCPAEAAAEPPRSAGSCEALLFPKQELRDAIREYFSIRPKRGFEKVTSRSRLKAELAKFEEVLNKLPDSYYVCGSKKIRGIKKR